MSATNSSCHRPNGVACISLLSKGHVPLKHHTLSLMVYVLFVAFMLCMTDKLLGHLLGDGSLVRKHVGGGTYFKLTASVKHEAYLRYTFDLFRQLGVVLMQAPSYGTTVLSGTVHQWVTFSTQSLKEWNVLHALWYPAGLKVVPADLLLTPVLLATWHSDDGNRTGAGIHLNTNGFTKEDVKRLAQMLEDQHSLKCSVHSRNRIYVWARSVPRFIELIRPHVHPSMGYKL
jgi:hypothetical protein